MTRACVARRRRRDAVRARATGGRTVNAVRFGSSPRASERSRRVQQNERVVMGLFCSVVSFKSTRVGVSDAYGPSRRLTRVVAVIGRARAAAAAAAAAASRGTASAPAASGVRPRPIASRGGARNHLVVSSSASSSPTTTMGGAAKEKKPPPPPSTVGPIEDLASKHPGLTSARERAPRARVPPGVVRR